MFLGGNVPEEVVEPVVVDQNNPVESDGLDVVDGLQRTDPERRAVRDGFVLGQADRGFRDQQSYASPTDPIDAVRPSLQDDGVGELDRRILGAVSEWWIIPGSTGWPVWSRRQSAIFRHASTNGVSFTVAACNPTIALEYRSIGGDVDEPTGQDEPIGFDLVATSTPIQRRAFELISQPIPQKLK